MLAVFTYANKLGLEPGLNSPELSDVFQTEKIFGWFFIVAIKAVLRRLNLQVQMSEQQKFQVIA